MDKIQKAGRAAFIFVFITVALDMLALGVIVPVLPKLILQFEGGNISVAAVVAGVFATVWAGMQFLASPVLGSLSDRFGRRKIILASNLGLGLDYLMMAWAPSVAWLFVGRIISGITAASYPTACAYIADVTPTEKRAAKFGMLGAAFGLGFVIGPAIGGLLGSIDLRLPFWFAGGLSLANFIYGFFILPESLPKEFRTKFSWKKANPIGSITFLKTNSVLFGLSISEFFSFIAHESLPGLFVLFTTYRFQWSEANTGWALTLVGVCSTVIQGGLVGPTVARLGQKRALYWGLICGAIGFALFAGMTNQPLFLLGILFTSLWGIGGSALQSLMTAQVGPSAQGQLQGAIGSLRGISGMMGPVIFTQSFAYAVGTLDPPIAGIPYYIAAGLILVALLNAWRVTRNPGT